MITDHDARVLREPPEFDVIGAAYSGEIGCFNCAHRVAEASNGEVFCFTGGEYYVENPDVMDWKEIAKCWECE